MRSGWLAGGLASWIGQRRKPANGTNIMKTITAVITFYPNARYPQLHQYAPDVPAGLKPRKGVEYGCGEANCNGCYEPRYPARKVSQ
jgi:hypothetical protein